jgi:hypothetical protein
MIYGISRIKKKVKSKEKAECNLFFCLIEDTLALVGPELAAYVDQVHQTYDWKVPRHITKKPTKLPAVERPLPGTSYNPTYDDHQVKDKIRIEIF